MELPGRVCIGLLEEDNPQKSYFRFKPLIASEGNTFKVCDGMLEQYPNDGAIRIVPDKNEAARFKSRMRATGRYCAADLREHCDDNDKIRINKNYTTGGYEPNAYIIYSDVITEIKEGTLVEVLDVNAPEDSNRVAVNMPMPGTRCVVLREGNTLWECSQLENSETGISLTRTDKTIDREHANLFEFEGGLKFYIADLNETLYTIDAAKNDENAAETASNEEKPAEEKPAAVSGDKPWIHHDESVMPKPIDSRLPAYEQAYRAQTGINPRRGRSIKEIIDEKWRISRLDQLGHSPDKTVTGAPVTSPVDAAYNAVVSAWENSYARQGLVNAISRIEGFGDALARGMTKAEEDARKNVIEELARKRDEVQEQLSSARADLEGLKEDAEKKVREALADELNAHDARISELTQREDEIKARAESAKAIAQNAEREIGELTDAKLIDRLSDFAITSRAGAFFTGLLGSDPKIKAVETDEETINSITLDEAVERVMSAFADEGLEISRDYSVCLLAAASIGDIMFSGTVGSGKTTFAKALLRALGRDKGENKIELADDINTGLHDQNELISKLNGGRIFMTAQDNGIGGIVDLRIVDRMFMVRTELQNNVNEWTVTDKRESEIKGAISDAALKNMFEMNELTPQVKAAMANVRNELAHNGITLTPRTLNDIYRFCAYVTPHVNMVAMEVFDLAFAMRAMPYIIATANPSTFRYFSRILMGMSRSLNLLKQPLPLLD